MPASSRQSRICRAFLSSWSTFSEAASASNWVRASARAGPVTTVSTSPRPVRRACAASMDRVPSFTACEIGVCHGSGRSGTEGAAGPDPSAVPGPSASQSRAPGSPAGSSASSRSRRAAAASASACAAAAWASASSASASIRPTPTSLRDSTLLAPVSCWINASGFRKPCCAARPDWPSSHRERCPRVFAIHALRVSNSRCACARIR
nr:hypothetical protein BJQ95_02523 [Cryobacterium sp. SO1]